MVERSRIEKFIRPDHMRINVPRWRGDLPEVSAGFWWSLCSEITAW